jgi:hypothetical protein
LELFIILSL